MPDTWHGSLADHQSGRHEPPVGRVNLMFQLMKKIRVRTARHSPTTRRSKSKKVWNTRSHRPSCGRLMPVGERGERM
jgi:hypothetical protein